MSEREGETVGEEGWTVLDGENDDRCAAYGVCVGGGGGGEGGREGGREGREEEREGGREGGDRLYQCRSSNLGTIVMNTY